MKINVELSNMKKVLLENQRSEKFTPSTNRLSLHLHSLTNVNAQNDNLHGELPVFKPILVKTILVVSFIISMTHIQQKFSKS